MPQVQPDSAESKTIHANALAATGESNDSNISTDGTEKEHSMTLIQGIKLYPKAVAWSILISTCIVMEGYDVSLVGNFCELL